MRHILDLRSVLFALFVFLGSPSMAQSQRLAIVEDYSGPHDNIAISRGGEPLRLELGAELMAGDVVTVSEEGYVVLRLGSGSRRVDAGLSPFILVDDTGPLEDMSANFDRVLDVIAWWDDSDSDEPMRSRDGVPPAIAALERMTTSRVLAGDRTFNLVWVDGKGPFKITIWQDDVPLASATAGTGIREATIGASLAPNQTYTLDLVDAGRDGNPTTSYLLTAIEVLPTVDVSIPVEDEFRSLLVMAELASVDRGIWAFEALQQLHELPSGSRFRDALINAIEHGDHP